MRTAKLMLIVLVIMSYFSCQNNKKEEANSQASSELTKAYVIKYGYVLFTLESPELEHIDAVRGQYDPFSNNTSLRIPEQNNVHWKKNNYISDVIKIENLDEDKKYKLIDEFEKDYNLFGRNKMDIEFNNDVSLKVMDFSKREELRKNKSKIIKREFFSFDSYAEASKMRRKVMEQN